MSCPRFFRYKKCCTSTPWILRSKGHFHGPLAPQAPRDSHSLGAASPRSPVSGCPHRALRVADALGLPEASTGFFFGHLPSGKLT